MLINEIAWTLAFLVWKPLLSLMQARLSAHNQDTAFHRIYCDWWARRSCDSVNELWKYNELDFSAIDYQ